MVRFISKKGENGEVRHIPISGDRRGKERKYAPNLHVKDNYDGNGDNEYSGKGGDPHDILLDVKKEVLQRLHTDAVKSTEELYFYDETGKSITRAQFFANGGSFDYIVESGDKKYQVNGEVSQKDRTWRMSGLGSWIREPDSNIGLESLFGKAVKDESVAGLGALFGNDPKPREHLYRNGAESREKKKFEKEYGKKKGDYVYGATVGKVKREREARRKA